MPGEVISNQPNLCLDQALGGRAVSVCAECPFTDPATECPAYLGAQALVLERAASAAKDVQIGALNERIADLEEQVGVLIEENLRYVERILGLKVDSLVAGMFTPEGLKDEILYGNAELAEKLRGNRWGAIQIDVRFLNFMNGALGQNQGDSFLQRSGERLTTITDGLIRTGPRRTEEAPVESERRSRDRRKTARAEDEAAPGYSIQGDPRIRRGGDEFTILILDVDPADLPGIAARIQKQLDVAAALKRAPDGLPFVASVGAAHVTDIDSRLMEGKDALSRYHLVDDKCNETGLLAKKKQYKAMWTRLVRDSSGELRGVRQPQDRTIAEMFITTYFRDFVRDNSDVLGERTN